MVVVCTLEMETSHQQDGKTTTNNIFSTETQRKPEIWQKCSNKNKQQTTALDGITHKQTHKQQNKTQHPNDQNPQTTYCVM